jgi:hypothetical protein
MAFRASLLCAAIKSASDIPVSPSYLGATGVTSLRGRRRPLFVLEIGLVHQSRAVVSRDPTLLPHIVVSHSINNEIISLARFIRIVTREVQDKAFARNDALSFET